MPEVNPYESPQQIDVVPKASVPLTPHTTSIRQEAWRGAKFGGKIGAIVFPGFLTISLLSLYIINRPDLESAYEILPLIGAFIGSSLYGLVLGALAGAIIMGIIATIRKAMHKKQD